MKMFEDNPNVEGQQQISRDEMRRAFESTKPKATQGGERLFSLSELLQEMREEDGNESDGTDDALATPTAELDGADIIDFERFEEPPELKDV